MSSAEYEQVRQAVQPVVLLAAAYTAEEYTSRADKKFCAVIERAAMLAVVDARIEQHFHDQHADLSIIVPLNNCEGCAGLAVLRKEIEDA